MKDFVSREPELRTPLIVSHVTLDRENERLKREKEQILITQRDKLTTISSTTEDDEESAWLKVKTVQKINTFESPKATSSPRLKFKSGTGVYKAGNLSEGEASDHDQVAALSDGGTSSDTSTSVV